MATEQKNTKAANKWNIPSDWEVNTVGKICDFIVPGRNKPKLFNGEIPWITTPDLLNKTVVYYSKIGLKISKEEAKEIGSKVVPKNSIIMSCVGELGLLAIAGIELVINQQLHAFIPKERINYQFLFYALNIQKKHLERVATKTAVPYLNKDNCNSVPIILPPLPEQKAIAKVLSTMDEVIQKNQQLITQKEQRKKWLMQQLLTGKKRLKGFSGKWKEYTLGEFIVESRIPSKENNPDNRITVKLNLNGIEKRAVRGTEMDDATSYFIRKAGQFIYGKQNLHKGAFGIIPIELDGFESSQDIPTFDFQENIVPTFFLYYVSQENFYTGLEKISTGTGSKRIHPEELYKVKVIFPLVEEQTAIAQVLQTADKEISLLKTKADKLKEQKKGLMQVLLTGKVRLNYDSSDFYDDHDLDFRKEKSHQSHQSKES